MVSHYCIDDMSCFFQSTNPNAQYQDITSVDEYAQEHNYNNGSTRSRSNSCPINSNYRRLSFTERPDLDFSDKNTGEEDRAMHEALFMHIVWQMQCAFSIYTDEEEEEEECRENWHVLPTF